MSKWVQRTYGVNFSEYFTQKNILFKTSLRRAQFELAMKGNPTMLIWLGKQYLGQNERTEVKFNASEVNAINKDMITNVAKERDLKDFEEKEDDKNERYSTTIKNIKYDYGG